MAIIFELVVNFGDDIAAARAAAERIQPGSSPVILRVHDHRITLRRPLIGTAGSHVELAFLPEPVSFGLTYGVPRIPLTAAEFTELGEQLYRLLASIDGYLAAIVGWDVEGMVDLDELRDEWSEELTEGSIDGLVLSDGVHRELSLGDNYSVFRPGFRWIPYRGEPPSELTADPAPTPLPGRIPEQRPENAWTERARQMV